MKCLKPKSSAHTCTKCVNFNQDGLGVIVAGITSQDVVHHMHRHIHEWPAATANAGSGAAVSDVVVICHINIEHELSLNRTEIFGIDCGVVFGLLHGKKQNTSVHRADQPSVQSCDTQCAS